MRHTVFHGRLASILVVAVLSGCATAPADRGLREGILISLMDADRTQKRPNRYPRRHGNGQ